MSRHISSKQLDKLGLKKNKSDKNLKRSSIHLADNLTREEKDKIYSLFSMVEVNQDLLDSTSKLQKKKFYAAVQTKSPMKVGKFIEDTK